MENKRKAAIVDQLIKKGFDPDPIKKWKDLQKKKELEESGDFDATEEEEQEEGAGDADKELDGKMSDYDHLVGMAPIKLSEEEKDKLLIESDENVKELHELESKSWADLWTADLEVFLAALDKQDFDSRRRLILSQERSEEVLEGGEAKQEKRNAAFAAEVFPSKDGIRIEPSIDKSLKEKYDKIKAAATRERKPKEPKEPKPPKEPKQPKKAGDDTKKFLSSEKKIPKKRKTEWDSDSSSSELSDAEDVGKSLFFEVHPLLRRVLPKRKEMSARGVSKRYSEEDAEMFV